MQHIVDEIINAIQDGYGSSVAQIAKKTSHDRSIVKGVLKRGRGGMFSKHDQKWIVRAHQESYILRFKENIDVYLNVRQAQLAKQGSSQKKKVNQNTNPPQDKKMNRLIAERTQAQKLLERKVREVRVKEVKDLIPNLQMSNPPRKIVKINTVGKKWKGGNVVQDYWKDPNFKKKEW